MNYKLIKLNNGEEIIGDVEVKDSSVMVTNPMVFITATLSDTSGVPINIVVLKDWLYHSDNKSVEIDNMKIVVMSDPNKKTMDYYNSEINKTKISPEKESEMYDKANKFMDEEMAKIFDQIIDDAVTGVNQNFNPIEDIPQPKKKKKKKKRSNPDEVEDPQMIFLSMMIPPEALMNMVTSGILDPLALQMMIEETKKNNRFTGDEKSRKDFGNKYSDWNPDPTSDDYK